MENIQNNGPPPVDLQENIQNNDPPADLQENNQNNGPPPAGQQQNIQADGHPLVGQLQQGQQEPQPQAPPQVHDAGNNQQPPNANADHAEPQAPNYGRFFTDAIFDRIRRFQNNPQDEQAFIQELQQRIHDDDQQQQRRNAWSFRRARERIGENAAVRPTEMLPVDFTGTDASSTDRHIDKFTDFRNLHGYQHDEDAVGLFRLTLSGPARLWYDKQTFRNYHDMITRFKRQFSEVSSKQDAMVQIRSLTWNPIEKPFEYMARVARLANAITPDFEFKADTFKQGLPPPARTFVSCANPQTEQDLTDTLERWLRDTGTTPATDTVETIAKTVLAAMAIKEGHNQRPRDRSPSPYRRGYERRRSKSPLGRYPSRENNPPRVRFTEDDPIRARASPEDSVYVHLPQDKSLFVRHNQDYPPRVRFAPSSVAPHSYLPQPPINIDFRLDGHRPRGGQSTPPRQWSQRPWNRGASMPRTDRTARQQTRCFQCNGIGHIARFCRARTMVRNPPGQPQASYSGYTRTNYSHNQNRSVPVGQGRQQFSNNRTNQHF